MAGSYYIGTDLKFRIDIQAEGFDMANDDFSIQLRSGNDLIEVPDDNIVYDEDGNYFLLVNTSQLKAGPLQMIVTANVPDGDFPNGVRREVDRVNLCMIKQV